MFTYYLQAVFCLLVVLILNHEGEAAKGGAKSIMRNRKGQQGAAGQSFLGYYGHNSNFGDRGNSDGDNWDDYDGSGDFDGSGSGDDYQEEFTPPCVGNNKVSGCVHKLHIINLQVCV